MDALGEMVSTSKHIRFWQVFCVVMTCCSLTGPLLAQEILTNNPGELQIAVTRASPTDPYDSQLWIRLYLEKFAQEQALRVRWVEVPFSESWLLASRNEVDIVATNVASFADRQSEGASFSSPFLYERRALRIRPEDRSRFSQIKDFVGSSIGVVRGMAAERDLDRRAVPGVNIQRTDSFPELYEAFDAGRLDAIAEAEYYSLDGEVIPSHGDDILLIDHHDLTPGIREESVFVVSDASLNLLDVLNQFIADTQFPLQ
ncbi:MAG: hypothetical protein CMD92_04590 [Gammaproteobacteria bacterium]|nr:hypothetical protein [Gammaproteobacteria bacterium]HBW84978.1 hypothetical protein [Gammaproteobacteria bacterium]|tara:strand:- start:12468 stop:13241 length:774 start_codon:yes stop_codon:yes gene_type:complete